MTITLTRSHGESTIGRFPKDPGLAAEFLTAILKDGDQVELQHDQQLVAKAHIQSLVQQGASDSAVWAIARDGGFVLVTRDADFEGMSVLRGAPLKVVWLCWQCPPLHRMAGVHQEVRHHALRQHGCR